MPLLFAYGKNRFSHDVAHIMCVFIWVYFSSMGPLRDQINWTANYLGTAPGITADVIKSYILDALPKVITGNTNAVEIGKNIVYESDHKTVFPIQFELVVGDVSNQTELLNSASQLFSDYSEAFCDQVQLFLSVNVTFLIFLKKLLILRTKSTTCLYLFIITWLRVEGADHGLHFNPLIRVYFVYTCIPLLPSDIISWRRMAWLLDFNKITIKIGVIDSWNI